MRTEIGATELMRLTPHFVARNELIGLRTNVGRYDAGKPEDNRDKGTHRVGRLDLVQRLG